MPVGLVGKKKETALAIHVIVIALVNVSVLVMIAVKSYVIVWTMCGMVSFIFAAASV